MLSWLIASALIAILALGAWYFKYRHRYIGFGWVLDHYKEDGSTRIVSHLLKSPAGREKIPLGSQLLKWNEVNFEKLTREEFQKRLEKLQPLRIGEEAVSRIRYPENAITKHLDNDTFVVRMRAEIIQGPIPVHRDYSFFPLQDDEWRYKRGMAVCKRTGQWFPTVRLSEEALDRTIRK